ncbi:Putative fluoride ion transporter CrcB [Paenibacillus sp. CECT 9249]|uniref:fluoride efflux transporter CrcB n=1 Tax=Paenibacillus sp. CECT 9249 TaxID=2845385 RepID=UPI001E323DE6|nr:fluoride efflux transporter CrcB [Paenibacillus sp. CECT 9249]CAH0119072.1 Putative fluoride ion transporter CrcB [Paenibacillus sp. CECT 9249]
MIKKMAAVGIGGGFGASARYLIGLAFVTEAGKFPGTTFAINLLGCLFLGWFFTVTLERLPVAPGLRLFVGTGFTGAFTTFSAFSVETVRLLENGQPGLALLYSLGSVVCGLLLTGAGIVLGRAGQAGKRPASVERGDHE